MLEGTSIDRMSTHESHPIPGLSNLRLARKSGRGVKTAVSRYIESSNDTTGPCSPSLQCVNCRNVGKRCDSGRPCSRCKRVGLSGCRDAPSKAKRAVSKLVVAGPSSDRPQPTASTFTPVYERESCMDVHREVYLVFTEAPQLVHQPAPRDITQPPSHICTEATDYTTRLWDPTARYFATDAQMPDTHASASTDGDDISPMTYYAYDHPARGQGHLNQFVPSTSFPPITVYTSADRHTVDMTTSTRITLYLDHPLRAFRSLRRTRSRRATSL